MDNHTTEREINILAILRFLLTKWKSIFIIAIVGLVLGAGYAAISGYDGSTPVMETDTNEEDAVAYNAASQIYEASKQRLATIEKYIAESAFMAIDPYNVYKGTMCYVITGTQSELVGANTELYSFVFDGELKSDLASIGPYTIKDLDILVGIAQNPEEVIVVDSDSLGQITLRVSIMTQSPEEAQELLVQMESLLDAYMKEMQSQQDIISYECVTSEIKEIISTTIAEQQSLLREKYNNEKSNLEIYKDNLNAVKADTPVLTDGSGVSKFELIKYGGVGFVAGIIIAAVIWVLIYLWGSKLYMITDKEGRFGVKQIASIYNFENLNRLDLWLGHKLNGVYSELPLDEQRNVSLLNIKNELKKRDAVKKVFIASSWNAAQQEIQIIKKDLEAEGYIVEFGERIIGNLNALKSAAQCDVSIVIESNNESKTDMVTEEIRVLKQYVDDILGMVIVQNKI